MSRVLILVGDDPGLAASLKAAIVQSHPLTEVDICGVSEFNSGADNGAIVCPLTLDLPSDLVFPGRDVYEFCRNVSAARDRVAQDLQVSVGDGNFWLPVVLTAKGPLYAEAIELSGELSYSQPLHLSDVWRQQLYELAFGLLELLNAPPATYLMQFGLVGEKICFDRLWPFPAAPAIASVGVQVPDLFLCHWYCLTNKPIYDMQITSLSF